MNSINFLYGLKQAPRAWYDRLSNFLLKNDFKRGQVDTRLFKKTLEKDYQRYSLNT